jgi:kynurenine formamidase
MSHTQPTLFAALGVTLLYPNAEYHRDALKLHQCAELIIILQIVDLTIEQSLNSYLKKPISGTHLCAPAFAFKRQSTIDQLKPDVFLADAVLLDLTRKKPGEAIDDEDMEAAEEDAGLAVREGEAVILHTGSHAESRASRKHAFLSENGAQYFEFKRVSMVGIDAASLGETNRSVTHKVLLKSNIPILEGLCNLNQIDATRFRLVALPLRVKTAVSPARALAILEQ